MNCNTARGEEEEGEEEGEEEETFVAASAAWKASSEESSVTLPPPPPVAAAALDEKVRKGDDDDVRGERKVVLAAAAAKARGARRLRSRAASEQIAEEGFAIAATLAAQPLSPLELALARRDETMSLADARILGFADRRGGQRRREK